MGIRVRGRGMRLILTDEGGEEGFVTDDALMFSVLCSVLFVVVDVPCFLASRYSHSQYLLIVYILLSRG